MSVLTPLISLTVIGVAIWAWLRWVRPRIDRWSNRQGSLPSKIRRVERVVDAAIIEEADPTRWIARWKRWLR